MNCEIRDASARGFQIFHEMACDVAGQIANAYKTESSEPRHYE